ncbi:circadian associated repressor of transcription a [Diretmus argenteus]
MQSQGGASSQPSFDSLSSSDSFLLSDSEQAEEDMDVFLAGSPPSGIIGGAGRVTTDRGGGSESPGSQWTCDGFTDKEEEEESDRSESSSGARLRVEEADAASQSTKTQGDLLFAQKCAELQGFVRPLLELLNGLKRGRFDHGLSSFQQSVAMDRIQRIVGVLQKPNSGEKYLNTLLQVEMMLKVWFPHVHNDSAPAASSPAIPPDLHQNILTSTPPHKHRDQLHIPVKKRRLSWTSTDSPTPSPVLLKRPHISGEGNGEKQETRSKKQEDNEGKSPCPPLASDAASDSKLDEDRKGKDNDCKEKGESSNYNAGQYSEPSLTWVHVAPILSPPKACPSHNGTAVASNNDNQFVPAVPLLSSRGSPATQDSSISSTTPYKRPKNLKKPIRCQSQPVAGQQIESETLETCPGQSQSPPVTLEPLSRVCPTPLET